MLRARVLLPAKWYGRCRERKQSKACPACAAVPRCVLLSLLCQPWQCWLDWHGTCGLFCVSDRNPSKSSRFEWSQRIHDSSPVLCMHSLLSRDTFEIKHRKNGCVSRMIIGHTEINLQKAPALTATESLQWSQLHQLTINRCKCI